MPRAAFNPITHGFSPFPIRMEDIFGVAELEFDKQVSI